MLKYSHLKVSFNIVLTVWPKSFTAENAAFGCEEIEVLSNYYSEQQYNSAEEANCMIEEWPILRDRVSTHPQNELILVYSDLLKEACTELKSILIMTISASTAACERGFLAMNREKLVFAHVSSTKSLKII